MGFHSIASPQIARILLGCLFASVFTGTGFVGHADTVGRTSLKSTPFPDSSTVDFRFLLDAPAGKHGFLNVDDKGHFAWPDGRRARFWGVNISSKSVWVNEKTIDRAADVLARAGCNMVRFEALDSTGGLLEIKGSNNSRKLNPARLNQLDYWIARLRERGIYYYLDLLDFRQFKSGDEVPASDQIGRAAKPYAFFDRRLIELQKEFARQLLTHKNPLTGLAYKDDPALALLEICNEHGLFFKADSLDTLAEPYKTSFVQQWNRWLIHKYDSRDAMKAAWGSIGDVPVLSEAEDPGKYAVMLPNFTSTPAPMAGPQQSGQPASDVAADVRRAPARLRDGVRFLYETQRGYFREMRTALKEIGVKIPITGVVSNELVPDVASAAAELDFTSENYYADHPTFAGKQWEGDSFLADQNPLRNSSTNQIAPWLAALRWENKPVVVREWATVWPNRYRAIAVPEIAAYAALQDFDAVLLFGYQIAKSPEALTDFDSHIDPPVWGLFGLGAAAFLQGHIKAAPLTATLAYNTASLFQWPNELTNLHRISWFVRLNSALNPSPTPKPVQKVKQVVRTAPRRTKLVSRGGRSRRSRLMAARAAAKSAPPKPKPVLANPLLVSPSDPDALFVLLAKYSSTGAGINPIMLETGNLRSCTAEVVRRTVDGQLLISTPRTVSICGELPVNKPVDIGPFRFISQTPIGALMAVSLDGEPLAKSRYFVVKMVSRAENTDQSIETTLPTAPGRYHLKSPGKPPILTFGRECGDVMRIKRGSQELLALAIADGTWELVVKRGQVTLVCDTPNIRGSFFGRQFTTGDNTPVTAEIKATDIAERPGAKVTR